MIICRVVQDDSCQRLFGEKDPESIHHSPIRHEYRKVRVQFSGVFSILYTQKNELHVYNCKVFPREKTI